MNVAPSSIPSAPLPLALFLCRANTAASIMAEAILRHLAQTRLCAASAGELPYGRVNSYALECLSGHGIATEGLRSRTWGEFWGLDKPPVRFLIALADVYAIGSTWSPNTIIARWYMRDPGALVGSDMDIRSEFEQAFSTLESRIRKFLALAFEQLPDRALSRELARIGEIASA
jgi:arsenate reductase (thioredoxin)